LATEGGKSKEVDSDRRHMTGSGATPAQSADANGKGPCELPSSLPEGKPALLVKERYFTNGRNNWAALSEDDEEEDDWPVSALAPTVSHEHVPEVRRSVRRKPSQAHVARSAPSVPSLFGAADGFGAAAGGSAIPTEARLEPCPSVVGAAGNMSSKASDFLRAKFPLLDTGEGSVEKLALAVAELVKEATSSEAAAEAAVEFAKEMSMPGSQVEQLADMARALVLARDSLEQPRER
jgi:hypothetical protein